MNDETREAIALERYKLISPILAEPSRHQNVYFKDLSERDLVMPHYGVRRYGVATFKSWLKRYRKNNLKGLYPTPRKDKGRPRRIKGPLLEALEVKCKAFPDWSVKKIYEQLLEEEMLGIPPVTYNTVSRLIKVNGFKPPAGQRTDSRKRFETDEINELWICDFMHGPRVSIGGGKSAKAILCAIIDDHSRLIVGYAFSTNETTSALSEVLKDAMMTYGIPKRFYVDNGSAFNSDLLLKACGQAGVSLIHSKPYDPQPRGKIERFFRTVRDRFLCHVTVDAKSTLQEINEAFGCWLRDDYHHKVHAGIDACPMDRFHLSAGRVDIARLSRHELDEMFLIRHERTVNNDATISFKSRIYEVPAAYIRQRVEIRHPVDDEADITLYDNGIRVAKLNIVDVKDNAKTFTPQKQHNTLSYARREVQS